MSTVIADLDLDESLSIVKKDPNKNCPIPLYIGIGRAGQSKHNIEGINSARIFLTLSGASSWFFWFLVGNRDYKTNLCDLRKVVMSPTERGRVSRAYKELSMKKTIVRFTKGIYLINPKIILPVHSNFEATWDKWVATCSKRGVPFV